MPLHVGDSAPDFKLDSTSGQSLSLSEDLKDQACLLFFYPKDFTPGCTKEVCDFRDSFETFKGLEIPVFGISTDSVTTHLKFKARHQLQFELLADSSGKVSKQYDAIIPVINLSRRVTYLLDKQHKIAAVYSDMFGAKNHIKTAIKSVQDI